MPKRIEHDWSNEDWGLSTEALARKIGCSVSTVRTHRQRHAPEHLKRQKIKVSRAMWRKVDWKLLNGVIAKKLGVSEVYVSQQRLQYAPGTSQPVGLSAHHRDRAFDWTSVDWSMRTKDIVEMTGKSQPLVSHARRRYAPHTLDYRRDVATGVDIDWSQSNVAISKQLGVTPSSVSQLRRKHAPPGLRSLRRRIAALP